MKALNGNFSVRSVPSFTNAGKGTPEHIAPRGPVLVFNGRFVRHRPRRVDPCVESARSTRRLHPRRWVPSRAAIGGTRYIAVGIASSLLGSIVELPAPVAST